MSEEYDYRPWARDTIAGSEERYRRDSNALHVWNAYWLCRRFDLPVPKWITDYFDRSAFNIVQAIFEIQRVQEIPNGRDAMRAVLEALEMKDPYKLLKSAMDQEAFFIAMDVNFFMQAHGLDETYAIGQAAKKHAVSDSTVRRFSKQHQATFKKLPKN